MNDEERELLIIASRVGGLHLHPKADDTERRLYADLVRRGLLAASEGSSGYRSWHITPLGYAALSKGAVI